MSTIVQESPESPEFLLTLAELKLRPGWFTTPKFEEAARLFHQAANVYTSSGNSTQAHVSFIKAGIAFLNANMFHAAIQSYKDAANECIRVKDVNSAVAIYENHCLPILHKQKLKRLSYTMYSLPTMYCEIGELLEKEKHWSLAIDNYKKAEHHYEIESAKTSIHHISAVREKIANLNVLLERFSEASEVYQSCAELAITRDLVKFNSIRLLLYAGITTLASKGTLLDVDTTKFYMWPGCREQKFLQSLTLATTREEFVTIVEEFTILPLKPWITTVLNIIEQQRFH